VSLFSNCGYFLCGCLVSISGYILILILHFRFRYGYVAGAGLEGELFLNWEKPYPGDYESEILGPEVQTPGNCADYVKMNLWRICL